MQAYLPHLKGMLPLVPQAVRFYVRFWVAMLESKNGYLLVAARCLQEIWREFGLALLVHDFQPLCLELRTSVEVLTLPQNWSIAERSCFQAWRKGHMQVSTRSLSPSQSPFMVSLSLSIKFQEGLVRLSVHIFNCHKSPWSLVEPTRAFLHLGKHGRK